MSKNESQTSSQNPITQIFMASEKMNGSSYKSTQSSLNKIPQGAKIIGNYLLGKTIGAGNFGKVYLAMHLPTSQKVAIKAIEKLKMNAEDIKRTKNQIEILKSVRHRHIVDLYQILQTQKNLLLVTEHLPNGELFQQIIKCKKIGEVEACNYFHQIISAVQYLHRNNIAHRDLKPQNILLDYDNQLKIIDFGLSSFYEKNELKTYCGSPCYAAPEMVSAKKHYNPLFADLWSCGVILYSMLCGHLPFCDTDTKILYKKILSCTYKIPSHVSPEARNLIQSLLVLTPSKRIGIREIQEHKWFNLVSPREAYGLDIGEHLSIDNHILSRLGSMGIKDQNVRGGIINNQKDKDTAAYYILMKKLVRGGDLVPSYIGNDNFNPKLIIKIEKKGNDDDTASLTPQPYSVTTIEAPQPPAIPIIDHPMEPGSCWWYDEYTTDEIKQINRSQLTLFASTILDVVISKYVVKPEINKINEILDQQQANEKKHQKGQGEKMVNKFYAFNTRQRNKVINLQQVEMQANTKLNQVVESYTISLDKGSSEKGPSISLNSNRNLLKKVSCSKNSQINTLRNRLELPAISIRPNQKMDSKILDLRRIYGLPLPKIGSPHK